MNRRDAKISADVSFLFFFGGKYSRTLLSRATTRTAAALLFFSRPKSSRTPWAVRADLEPISNRAMQSIVNNMYLTDEILAAIWTFFVVIIARDEMFYPFFLVYEALENFTTISRYFLYEIELIDD